MEMCVDNPRQGFGELFDTHPTVDARVAALVKFAGGHDPGPIALPPPAGEVSGSVADESAAGGPWDSPPAGGPWGPQTARGAGRIAPAEADRGDDSGERSSGPWGPHRGG